MRRVSHAALQRLEPQADAIITCGGAGRSERDLVTAALAGLGWVEQYHHVRCVPGKTTSMGAWNGKPVFCLPGSPGANLAAFLILALPALLRLAGRAGSGLSRVQVEIAEPVRADPAWTRILPGILEQQGSSLVFRRPPGSGALQEMARATALLVVPEGAGPLEAGMVAEALVLPGATLPAGALPQTAGGFETAPVVSFVSKSGCGRTTFLEKLLPELAALGVRTGILKHHVHTSGFDVPGKDTDRLARAGAARVVGMSPVQVALFEQLEGPAEAEKLVQRFMADLDLVLTDGLRRAAFPKIEVHRAACGDELLCEAGELLALVTDEPDDRSDAAVFDRGCCRRGAIPG